MLNNKSNDGAVAIEFAIACLFFFIAVFGILEMARILVARTLLIKGAQDAAILASQYPDMEIEIPESTLVPGTPNYASPQYLRYATARQKIIDEATSLPGRVLLNSQGSCPGAMPCRPRVSQSGLQVITTFDTRLPGAPTAFFDADAAIFRPDRWDTTIPLSRKDKDLATIVGPGSMYPAEYQLNLASPAGLQSRLSRYPIVVEMRAQVTPLAWFMGPIELVARGSAFREPSVESALGLGAGFVPPILPPIIIVPSVSSASSSSSIGVSSSVSSIFFFSSSSSDLSSNSSSSASSSSDSSSSSAISSLVSSLASSSSSDSSSDSSLSVSSVSSIGSAGSSGSSDSSGASNSAGTSPGTSPGTSSSDSAGSSVFSSDASIGGSSGGSSTGGSSLTSASSSLSSPGSSLASSSDSSSIISSSDSSSSASLSFASSSSDSSSIVSSSPDSSSSLASSSSLSSVIWPVASSSIGASSTSSVSSSICPVGALPRDTSNGLCWNFCKPKGYTRPATCGPCTCKLG